MIASTLTFEPMVNRDNELQRTAVRVALRGSRFERLRFGAKTLVSLMRDTQQTEYVLALTLLVNAPSFPRVWMQVASTDEGRALLRERPSLDSRAVDRAALRALPSGTLGREYARFLDDNGLDGDFFQAPPDVPDEVAFLSKRLRQSHDVWHAVTGYTPSVRDEIALQAFTYGQLGAPHAILIVLGGLAAFGWRDVRLFAHAWRGYRNGKRAAFLGALRWESRWERPLEALRAELGVAAP
jgi:ubiquinone biosynthesis protein COQ4